MATLAQGQAARLNLKASQSITVTPSSAGQATVSANGPSNLTYEQKTIYAAETFGPYVADTVMNIAAVFGSLEYTDPYTLVPSFSTDSSGNVTGLVGPDGETLILPMVLGQQASASSVTGTTAETVLYSLLMPIGTIIAGDILRVEPVWTYTNSANNKILAAKIGPTLGTAGTLHTRTRTTTAFEGPLLEIAVRTLSTQIQLYSLGGSYAGGTAGALNTHTFDFAVENTLYITGTLANSGETIALEAVKITRLRS